MTQARTRAHGVVTPSPIQLLLEAALRVLVSLVQGIASTLQMIFNRSPRDWHTSAAQEVLPRETSDIRASTFILRDDHRSASIPQDEVGGRIHKGTPRHKCETTQALILSRPHRGRPSKDGGVLTRLTRVRRFASNPRRTSGSRANHGPCPDLQLQAHARVKTVPGFRPSS